MARAGLFRDRVSFQRQATTVDDYGNSRGAWAAVAPYEVWGNLMETPGREVVAAGAVASPQTATLRIRYSTAAAALRASDRCTVRGKTWNIRSEPTQVGVKPGVLEMLLEAGVAT